VPFIGIDGGGSHTRALLCDSSGRILGRGLSGPSNPKAHSEAEVESHLREAIEQALGDNSPDSVQAMHLGIAGASDPESVDSLQKIARQALGSDTARIGVGHDLDIALEGGLAGEAGILLVAGTGSASYGRNPEGVTFQCGGWGDLVDDAGSGSWIGLRALQDCVRQSDGRQPESLLRTTVMNFLKIRSMDAFKSRIHREGLSRRERAELAPAILDLAQNGDPAACRIAEAAARELSLLVETTRKKLHFDQAKVVLAGGLTQHMHFGSLLKQYLQSDAPGTLLMTPSLDATTGAAIRALKSAGLTIQKIHRSRLANSQD